MDATTNTPASKVPVSGKIWSMSSERVRTALKWMRQQIHQHQQQTLRDAPPNSVSSQKNRRNRKQRKSRVVNKKRYCTCTNIDTAYIYIFPVNQSLSGGD